MFKKLLTTVLLAFTVVSCKPAPNKGADGYQFGTPQYEKQQVTINVVTYQKRSDLLKEAKKYGANSETLVAFSVLKFPFDTCTVHMVDPRVKYEPEFIGHEFAHCVYGQWHTNNDSRS